MRILPTTQVIRAVTRFALVVTLAGAGIVAVTPSAALAAGPTTLTVTSYTDIALNGGACGDRSIVAPPNPAALSLREATCIANNLGGNVTILLGSAQPYDLTGELQVGLESGQNVTIVGNGSAQSQIVGNGATRVLDLDPKVVGGVGVSLDNLEISNGNDSGFGGAGIIAGSAGAGTVDTLTIANSTIDHNTANTASPASTTVPGGGIQFIGGTLVLDHVTVANNSSGSSAGGGVYYASTGTASGESLTIADSSFVSNTMAVSDYPPVTTGGAGLVISGPATTPATITDSSFTGNTVNGGSGASNGAGIWQKGGALTVTGSIFSLNGFTGAVAKWGSSIAATAGSAELHYNRFEADVPNITSNNVSSSGTATVDATENWWRCNTAQSITANCSTSIKSGASASITTSPRLVLTATADPATVTGPDATSTVTASLLVDSLGGAVAPADLGAFTDASVSFTDPAGDATVGGSAGTKSVEFSGGTASVPYDSGSVSGTSTVAVTFDAVYLTPTITVQLPAAFTSPNEATFVTGQSGSFAVTTSGSPDVDQFVKSGQLPSGLDYTTSGNTATISGTPDAGTEGSAYPITLYAYNGVNPGAMQVLTVYVEAAPAVTTSPSSTTVAPGESVSLAVTGEGIPTPAVQWQVSTNAGGAYTDISGATSDRYDFVAAAADDGNLYRAILTNSHGSATSSAATVSVGTAPSLAATGTTMTVGVPGHLVLSATGTPTPVISGVVGVQDWMAYSTPATNTAELDGTPPAGSGGTYEVDVQAQNGFSPNAHQSFTLTVLEPTAITSGATATFTQGSAGSFTVRTHGGYPSAVAISAPSADLPPGMTLTDAGNGTATLAGTPTAVGTFGFTITATNGTLSTTQDVTVTVDAAAVVAPPVVAPVVVTPATVLPLARADFAVQVGAFALTSGHIAVTASRLAPGEAYRVLSSGRVIATGVASAHGSVSRSLRLPGFVKAGRHTITVVGASSVRSGADAATVLQASKKLTVTFVPSSLAGANRTLLISVAGLAPHEPVTLQFHGKVVSGAHAVASRHGKFSVRVSAGWSWGYKKAVAVGFGAHRRGVAKIDVESPAVVPHSAV
jgi:hypothetical protein